MLKCASKKKTLNIHAHAGMQIPSINTAMRSSMVGICVLYWTSGNGFCSVQSSRENTEWILLHSRITNLAERWSKYWRDDFNRHAFVISVSYISWIDESLSMQAHYPALLYRGGGQRLWSTCRLIGCFFRRGRWSELLRPGKKMRNVCLQIRL